MESHCEAVICQHFFTSVCIYATIAWLHNNINYNRWLCGLHTSWTRIAASAAPYSRNFFFAGAKFCEVSWRNFHFIPQHTLIQAYMQCGMFPSCIHCIPMHVQCYPLIPWNQKLYTSANKRVSSSWLQGAHDMFLTSSSFTAWVDYSYTCRSYNTIIIVL